MIPRVYLLKKSFLYLIFFLFISVLSNAQLAPNEISGLEFWISADQGVTTGIDEKIISIEDQSSNSHDVFQSNLGLQPILESNKINNLPVIHFDGIDDYLNTSNISNIRTIFIITKHKTGVGNSAPLLGHSSLYDFHGGGNTLFSTFTNNNIKNGNVRINKTPASPLSVTYPIEFSLISISTTDNVSMNQISKDRNVNDRVWDGYFAEIILFNRELSQEEIEDIEDYLLNKYSPSLNLGNDINSTLFCSQSIDASANFSNYKWSTGEITNSISVSESDEYSIEAIDQFGFSHFDTIKVLFPFTSIQDTTFCFGDSVLIHSDLGNDFTYNWSTGETTDFISIKEEDDYSVIIKDLNSCSKTYNFSTNIDSFSSTPNFLGPDINLCQGNTISIPDDIAIDSSLWESGETSNSLIINSSDNYSIQAFRNGCIINDTISVEIKGVAPFVNFDWTPNCSEDFLIDFKNLSSSLDTGTISKIHWHVNNDTILSSNHKYYFPTHGDFKIKLEVESSSSCQNSIEEIITIPPPPSIIIDISETHTGQKIIFNDVSIFTPFEFNSRKWNILDDNLNTIINSSEKSISIETNNPSFYHLQLTDSIDGKCEIKFDSTIFVSDSNICFTPSNFNDKLEVWLDASDYFVKDSSIQTWFDKSGNGNDFFQFNEDFKPITSELMNSINSNRTIKFDGVNDFLKTNTPITVSQILIIGNFNTENDVFPNYNGLISPLAGDESEFLFAANSNSNNFLNKGIFKNNIYINTILTNEVVNLDTFKIIGGRSEIPKLYSDLLIASDRMANGRYWDGNIAEILIFNEPLTNSEHESLLTYIRNKYSGFSNLGPNIYKNDFCSVNVSPDRRFSSNKWNNQITSDSLSISETKSISVISTDIFGFESFDTLSIEFPGIFLNDSTICIGDSIVWDTQLSSDSFSFDWNTGSTNPTETFHNEDDYSLTIQDKIGCKQTYDISIKVDSFINFISIGDDRSICQFDSLEVEFLRPNLPIDLILWNETINSKKIEVISSQDFTISVSNLRGCKLLDTISINVQGVIPKVDFKYLQNCTSEFLVDFTSLISGDEDDLIQSYEWNIDGEFINKEDFQFQFNSTGPYLISLKGTTVSGCKSELNREIELEFIPKNSINKTGNCTSELFHFDSNNSIFFPVTNFQWNIYNSDDKIIKSSNQNDFNFTHPEPGYYQVELVKEIQNKCIQNKTIRYEVLPDISCEFPVDISSKMSCWLDASVLTDSLVVSQWNDKSLKQNHAIQIDTSFQPTIIKSFDKLHNNTVVRLNGEKDYFKLSSSIDIQQVFIIANYYSELNTFSNFEGLLSPKSGGSSDFLIVGDKDRSTFINEGAFKDNISVNQILNSKSNYLNNVFLLEAISETKVTVKDLLIGSDRLANGRFWNGAIAEIIIFDEPLTTEERDNLLTYIQYKYSPPVDLGPNLFKTDFCETVLQPSRTFPNLIWDTGVEFDSITISDSKQRSVEAIDHFNFLSVDTIDVTYPGNTIEDTTICLNHAFIWDSQLDTTNYTITWSDGSNDSIYLVTKEELIQLQVEDSKGCSLFNSVYISVDSFELQANLGIDKAVCEGESIQLESGFSSANIRYWNTSDTSQQLVINSPGQYSIQVTNQRNCNAKDTIELTIQGKVPDVDFEVINPSCINDTLQMNDLTVSPAGTILNSWKWQVEDIDSSLLQNPKFKLGAIRNFNFKLSIETDDGCIGSTTKPITVYPSPVANFSTGIICHASPLELTSNSNIATGSIINSRWKLNAENWGIGTTIEHEFSDTGLNQLILEVTSDQGCVDQELKIFNVEASPIPNFHFTTSCPGLPVRFESNVDISKSGLANIQWYFDDGSTSVLQKPTHIYNETGNFDVNLTATRLDGLCSKDTTITINVKEFPSIQFPADPACILTEKELQNISQNIDSIISWKWEINNTIVGNDSIQKHTFTELGATEINLTIVSEYYCETTRGGIISVVENPIANFDFTPKVATPPAEIEFINESTGDVTSEWAFGDGDSNFATSPFHIYPNKGTYSIQLVSISEYGCRDSILKDILIDTPKVDLSIVKILTNQENEFINFGIEIQNTGNKEVQGAWFELKLGVDISVKQLIDQSIPPYGKVIVSLNNFLEQRSTTQNFVCVEIKSDEFESNYENNTLCQSLETESKTYSIFPNPTSGSFTITINSEAEEEVKIDLYDAFGKIVKTDLLSLSTGFNQKVVDISSLRSGQYRLVLRSINWIEEQGLQVISNGY